MTTKEHSQLCAAAIAAHAVIELLAVGVLAVLFGVGWAVAAPEISKELARSPDPEGAKIAGGLMLLVFVIAASLLLMRVALSAFAAWGIWRARPWAKVVGIIACAFSCMSFPMGTAVGAYGLWFILGVHGTKWLNPPPTPGASSIPNS